MQKTCTHCGKDFDVHPDDLALYEKLCPEIAGKRHVIPPPTLCPVCRQRRRMSFRNERQLYKRTCDVTGKDIISVFSPESPHKVCEKTHWYSDAFEPLDYGRDYDFGKPFFEQFQSLALAVPLPSLRVELSENCDFNNDMRACANCYLCARTHQSQNLLYSYRGNKSNDCVDCTQITECSFLYDCVECQKCNDGRSLFFCTDCASSSFLLDCRNCMNCFMCCNLRSKQYCFLNQQLTKDEYQKKIREFDFGSSTMIDLAHSMYADIRKKAIRRALMISNCENATGDNLSECKNCADCFGAQKCIDSRYLWDVKLHRDSMDEYSGGRDSELMYETTSGSGSYDVQFCLRASDSQHIRYSFYITSCKNLFGCVGLKRKGYCILNKQYSEEEYGRLVPKIIDAMRSAGEWGEFFPASLSPFAYNETVAQEYYPLTKNTASALGYPWKEEPAKKRGEKISDVPDSIFDIKDDIITQLLCCEICKRPYKVTQQELAFYRARSIPVPKTCVDCRHLARLAAKNRPEIRMTECKKCKMKIQTTFPEGCPEQVYCDECYLKEVY